MGRVHPFFRKAGMVEFDRPPLAGHVRLVAALAHEGLVPLDLVGARKVVVSEFLRGELERFMHRGAEASAEELVSRAAAALLSQPLYYLWKSK
jgi:hypothetical protein